MSDRHPLSSRGLATAGRVGLTAYAVAACAAAAYIVGTTTWTATQTYTRILFWDMFKWIDTLRAWLEHGFTWSSLFAFDGEHRIAVARLLFFLDYWVDSQNGRLLTAILLAQYFAAVVVLAVLFRRAMGPDRSRWFVIIPLTAVAAVLLFAGSNLEVIQFGFQVVYAWPILAMPVAALLVVLTVEALNRDRHAAARAWATLTIVACASATYSSGAWVPIWPIVLGLAFLCGAPKRYLMAIAVSAVICIALYFVDYRPGGVASRPSETLLKVETYAQVLPLLLANPFAPEFEFTKIHGISPHAWFVVFGWLGIFGAVGLMCSCAISQLSRRPWQPAQLALLSVVVHTFLICLMIALMRQNWGWTVALVDRYRTAPALFWSAGLMLVAVLWSQSSARNAWMRAGAGGLIAIMMTSVVLHQRDALGFYAERHQRWLVAADAQRTGVNDWQAFQSIAWVPGPPLLPYFQFLRDRRLSVFSDRRFELMGTRSDAQATAKAACSGGVGETIAIPGDPDAWRLWGSAWDDAERRSPPWLLFVDSATGNVVGLGTGGLWLIGVPGSKSQRHPKQDGWAGYVRAPAGTAIGIFGAGPDGRPFCLIAKIHVGR